MLIMKLKKKYHIIVIGFASLWIVLQVISCSSVKEIVKPKPKPKLYKPQVFFREGDAVKPNSVVPTFIAPTIKGDIVDTSDTEGKVILLNFWSIRCGPCIKEMPYLEKLLLEYKDAGLVIISINTDQASTEKITELINKRDFTVTYNVLADPDLVLSSVFTKWFVPVTILIDSKGIMRYINTGFTKRDYKKYRKLIANIIKEQS